MEAMVSRHFGHDRQIIPWPSRPCGSKGVMSYIFLLRILHSSLRGTSFWTSSNNCAVFKTLPETGWADVAIVRPVLAQKMPHGMLRCSCVLDITARSCIFFAHNRLCT